MIHPERESKPRRQVLKVRALNAELSLIHKKSKTKLNLKFNRFEKYKQNNHTSTLVIYENRSLL